MGKNIAKQTKFALIKICTFFINKLNGFITKMRGEDIKDPLKESKKRITALNKSILNRWISLWDANATNKSYKEDFQEVVEANYYFFKEEAKHNSLINFTEKGKIVRLVKISAVVIGLFSLCIFVICMVCIVVVKKDIDFTSFLPLLIIICILLAAYLYASVKSIEVGKYQETWARHQNSFFLMQSEMVKYCNHLSPYDKQGDDIDKLFMERIMAVLEINNSKFVANMVNKEMQLSDLPGKIIVKN